jgi:hypothetical protein
MESQHTWKFFRAGGFDQVQLDTAADLLALHELDQKLWVALSCPTRGIEFDSRTLDMIDTDADGYVLANEVLAAVSWVAPLLKNSEALTSGSDRLVLSNINDSTTQGRQILSSARHVLNTLGKPEASEIALADLQGIEKFFAGLKFNGDGVICAQQIDELGLRGVIDNVAHTIGTVTDASGEAGVNQAACDQFFAEAAAYVAWHAKADAAIFLLGDASAEAAQVLQAVKEKVTDYFTRCQIAAYDERATLSLSRSLEDYQKIAADSLSAESAAVAAFPLATIAANKPLPLMAGLNPTWQAQITALRERVITPLLGERQSITAAEWSALCDKFNALESWQKEQPASRVGELGISRLREILAEDFQAKINAYIKQDEVSGADIKEITSLERLLRYQRDLLLLANNFVSFRDFYSGKKKATFQLGTLYLDGRSCELCIRVDDVNTHAGYANSSGVCLVYCELQRKGAEKMNIVAAFTAGDADFLKVGRHGIFYDRKGADWNATIVRIVDHPISIRQAFWSPYKKVSAAISEQMQKVAATKANAGHEERVQAVNVVTSSVVAPPSTPPKPAFDVAKFAGIFAAIGLAIGAIGGILASIVGGIVSLKFWQIPFALFGLMLAISGPSMLLAWFKLKRRNLGPILDACGWAINARVLINIPFGTSLTALAELPKGAHRSLVDPYAEKKSLWYFTWTFLLLWGLMFLAWYVGLFSK